MTTEENSDSSNGFEHLNSREFQDFYSKVSRKCEVREEFGVLLTEQVFSFSNNQKYRDAIAKDHEKREGLYTTLEKDLERREQLRKAVNQTKREMAVEKET